MSELIQNSELTQDDSINIEEFVNDYLDGDQDEEGDNWQDQFTECDFCHHVGRIAKHLQDSTDCLRQLRAQPSFQFRGSDELFAAKTALIIGECPNPACETGLHSQIPQDCLAWWKREGWRMFVRPCGRN